MQHILILGGSGRTGELVISEALIRGHTITALVRDPTALPERQGVSLVKGTPLEKSDIEQAFALRRPDAVVVTLNARRATDSPFSQPISPPRFMADSVQNARNVMEAHGVRKIVIMSAAGTRDSFASLNVLVRFLFNYSNMKFQYIDHGLVDDETKASTLDYVLVRPTMLTDGPKKDIKELGNEGEKSGWFPSISRSSVASFLIDAVEGDDWVRSTPVISN